MPWRLSRYKNTVLGEVKVEEGEVKVEEGEVKVKWVVEDWEEVEMVKVDEEKEEEVVSPATSTTTSSISATSTTKSTDFPDKMDWDCEACGTQRHRQELSVSDTKD
jgi:hypothetical protein